ncbi:hypothetical protein [Maridesulfovibrio sp.]
MCGVVPCIEKFPRNGTCENRRRMTVPVQSRGLIKESRVLIKD